ncbi:MAG TPA: hypothetical protein VGF82_02995 [Terracidiphilus sp.]|jgi:hypothetical protein
MKRLFGCALMLTLAVAPALAAKNSQSISLASPVKVGTTNLAAGDCKVTWTGEGDTVQVTLAGHGKSITVPAKLVAEKNNHKGYTVNSQGGADELQTIQLNNITLRLVSAPASGQ